MKRGGGLRLILSLQLFWLGLVCGLGAWWGSLLLKQGFRIMELESASGLIGPGVAEAHWYHLHRMLFWEGSSYFALLLASTGLLFWVHWRDVRRTRSLQAFFASVTHELRTPLTSIRLQSESIAENLAGDQSQKHLVDRLLEDTVRMEGTVERTLELARVEGGGSVFPQPIALKPWLERMVAEWSESHRGKAEVTLEVDDVLINADPAGLQVIFKNLFENAVRHSHRPKVKVGIKTVRLGDQIQICFKDDGREFKGNVKNAGLLFQKGPDSPGAGVGLYLVRTLMGRMGGRATFEFDGGFLVSLCFAEGRADG